MRQRLVGIGGIRAESGAPDSSSSRSAVTGVAARSAGVGVGVGGGG